MQGAEFEQVYDFGNLYAGFLKARRGKRHKPSVAKFEANLLEALCLLSEMLKTKTYRPSDYFVFKVYEPKERIVMTNAFKDKVVQHSLCDNILEPAFSKAFIRDNYASQSGRGTHDGLYRLEEFMRSYYFTRKANAERERRAAGLPPPGPEEVRHYTDAITFGWTSVAYRVKAYDSAGAESAYNTSATRTVVNNHAPVISGTDSNLGTKTAAFAQSYSVTDEDSGQTLTVTEYIDGTQKRSYTATSGQTYSFNITAAEWVKLLNGSHTLKIVAADNYGGSATRTYTFTKNETEIELTLATPLTADDMVTKGIMSVVRQIPAGAKFTVEVCNNGNDASPTWEDVTQNVVSGSKFFLSNTTKTASAWGYNFRIKVKRGTATGDCFITSAGGNFE